ncbi:MAG: FtsX-like permease family protein, partial [Lachnospiraceae bacterium]|nr:FtsX-like permease family protein [Lachnospiraceae bacterium]
MKNAAVKDFLREIKKSLSRYLSLIFIVALGVAFFSGVRSSEPDMRLSVDRHYDELRFMDIRVLGTLGLSDNDVAAIAAAEGVSEAEGAKSVEALCAYGDETLNLRVNSIPEKVSLPRLTSGRLPENSGECLMDDWLTGRYELGDVIALSGDGEDLTETLEVTEFTITGFGKCPDFLNFSRGTSSIGNGKSDGFLYILPDDFSTDYYTVVYARVEGAAELTAYSDAYEDTVKAVTDRLEAMEDERCEARYNEVVDEAKEKLADARQEYNDKKAEADEKIADAEQKLADGEQELADAEKKVADGEQDLADAEQELADAEKELEDGRKEIEDAEKELKDGRKELDDGWKEYNKGKKELEDAEKELKAGEKELAAKEKEWNTAKKKLDDGEKQLTAAEKEAAEGEKQLEAAEKQLAEGEKQLTAGEKELAAQEKKLAEGEKALEQGEKDLEQAEKELEAGKKELAAGEKELEQNEALLKEKEKALEEGEKELEKNQAEYEEALAQFEAMESLMPPEAAAEARAKLEAAKAQLDAAAEELSQGRAGVEAGKKQLEAGKKELEESKIELEAGEKKIAQGKQELQENKKQLAEGKKQLEAGKKELASKKKELEAGKKELESKKKELAAGKKELAAKRKELEAGKKELAAGKKQLDAAKTKLNKAKKQISDGKKELEKGRKELEANEKKYADGKKELDEAKQKLADGEKELEDGRKEVEDGKKELEDARQEIADAKQKLEDGRKELDDAKAEADEKLADADKKLTDAEHDIEEIEVPEWYVLDRNSIQDYVEYGMDTERIGSIGKVFPAIFFLVAALVSLTSMTRMVEEKRTEIGTWKALGYSRGAITAKFMLYAFSACIIGSVLGVVTGSKILPYVILGAYDILYINIPYKLIPIQWDLSLLSSLIAIACIMAATWFACHRTLNAVPAQLMRPTPPKSGKRILLERVGFIWNRLNFTRKSTLRNLFRFKKRFFMTVFGIGGCMALLLVGFGLRDSIAKIVDTQYQSVWTYDASLTLKKDSDSAAVQAFADSRPEIEGTIRDYRVAKDVEANGVKKEGYLFVPEDGVKVEGFLSLRNRLDHNETYRLEPGSAVIT